MPWDYLDTGHVNPKTAFRPAPHSALSDVVSVHQDTGTPRDEPDQHTDHDEDDCDDHRTRLTHGEAADPHEHHHDADGNADPAPR
ncbi:hypothetical protein [Actinophytocola sp.]|uniref:hypothetical protein n=1 Tax=Actinophytocola sp. TaxID=1872138 RepID=UPI002D508C78|nr:hypothetical protein [Actinophytocola sp.]HYQ62572.1 hypothetical protein [Actinophytocola sp.]